MLAGIVGENVGYENLNRVTGASVAGSFADEVGERDFSSEAISRARAALPTAPAIGPHDVIGAALFEEAETGAVVAAGHGGTVLLAMNSRTDARGIITREPTGTCTMRRSRTSVCSW